MGVEKNSSEQVEKNSSEIKMSRSAGINIGSVRNPAPEGKRPRGEHLTKSVTSAIMIAYGRICCK